MAENIPNIPSGAVPPKKDTGKDIPNVPAGAVPPKKETGKVQPKKETVRINLPPKPSTAPTIKMPTLPPGGPTGAASGPAPAAAPATTHSAAPPASTRTSVAAPVAQRPPATVAPKPVPAPAAARTVSMFDTILAIAAAVAGLFAVGTVLLLLLKWLPTQ
jgi:hypothetical protein